MTATVAPLAVRPAPQVDGVDRWVTNKQVREFVREQLAAVDLDGRSVCVLVPDGTRSCPMPLLLGAVHEALHGRVTPVTIAAQIRHPLPHGGDRAGPAPGLSPGCVRAAPTCRCDRAPTTSGGTRTRSSRSARSAPSGSRSCPRAASPPPVGAGTAEPGSGRARRHPGRRAGIPARGGGVLRRQTVLLSRNLQPGGHQRLALARHVDHQCRDHRHPWHHASPRDVEASNQAQCQGRSSRSSWWSGPLSVRLGGLRRAARPRRWRRRRTSATWTPPCARCCRSSRRCIKQHLDGCERLLQGRAGGRRRRPGGGLRAARHGGRRDAPGMYEVGYHCRDYFVKQWDRFPVVPWGVLAHSTHLRGAATTRPPARSAAGSPSPWPRRPGGAVRAVNLDYLNPAEGDAQAWAAEPDTLVVPRAGRTSSGSADRPRALARDRLATPPTIPLDEEAACSGLVTPPPASASRSPGCGGSVSTLRGKAGRRDGSAPRCPTPGRWRYRPLQRHPRGPCRSRPHRRGLVPAGGAGAAPLDGRRVVLHFESATRRATVWVNDVEVVAHEGRYTPFEADVTAHVRAGEPRRVTVAVDNALTFQTVPPGVVEDTQVGKLGQRYWHDFLQLRRHPPVGCGCTRPRRPTSPTSPS